MGLAMQVFSSSKRELCAALSFSRLLSTHLWERTGKHCKTMMIHEFSVNEVYSSFFFFFFMHCVILFVEQLEEGEKDLVRSQEYKYCYVQVSFTTAFMHISLSLWLVLRNLMTQLVWGPNMISLIVKLLYCSFKSAWIICVHIYLFSCRSSLRESLDGVRGSFWYKSLCKLCSDKSFCNCVALCSYHVWSFICFTCEIKVQIAMLDKFMKKLWETLHLIDWIWLTKLGCTTDNKEFKLLRYTTQPKRMNSNY